MKARANVKSIKTARCIDRGSERSFEITLTGYVHVDEVRELKKICIEGFGIICDFIEPTEDMMKPRLVKK